jgi:hypothetical protein
VRESYCISQAGLKLSVLQPVSCWDYTHALPHLVYNLFFTSFSFTLTCLKALFPIWCSIFPISISKNHCPQLDSKNGLRVSKPSIEPFGHSKGMGTRSGGRTWGVGGGVSSGSTANHLQTRSLSIPLPQVEMDTLHLNILYSSTVH